MITAVLDTNVLASGFVASRKDSAPVLILDAWRNRAFTLVVSEPILAELAHTLVSPYFRRRLTPELVAEDLALLRTEATVSPITSHVHGVASHPEDDVILSTAVSAKADYLVTEDAHLQGLRRYKEVEVLSPSDFLAVLLRLPRK